MRQGFQRLWHNICQMDEAALDFLFPPRCPVCDKVILPKDALCPDCRRKAPFISGPVCMKCGKPIADGRKEFCLDCERKQHHFVQGKALWIYENEVKASIYRFKYQNRREYGKRYAAKLAGQYRKWIADRQIQAVVPVPLHKKKKKRRGYNQAEILAKELGRSLGLPVYTDVLVRIRDTRPQKTLNHTERKNNLKGAFKTTENIVQLKYILLVDDIYTTGSTLDAAARALKDAGAEEIYVCCISIGRDC